ncbi:MAG: 50S ribosomal protein L22 [Firmicutes bacterium]|nr:50S ribosomal protein L22 [Bacillota bacterium]
MATRVKLKTEKINKERDKRPHAHANHIRISPSKVRIVLDIVRGKSVNNAFAILQNTPKSASEPVYKLIASAVANAENNLNLSREDLYVAEIYASGGPVLKRSIPRAKGRSTRILKRTSHITVILDQLDGELRDSLVKKTDKASKPVKATSKPASKATTTKPKAPAATAKKVETKKVEPKKADEKSDAKVSKPVAKTEKKVESKESEVKSDAGVQK